MKLVLGAVFLALALVLPFLTMQIPKVGKMLCPMHLPVLLCGFFCGPVYGAIIGFIAPLLRFMLFGMPDMPGEISMCFELLGYGLVSGLLYRLLPKKKICVYVSLIGAMLVGRVFWAAAKVVLYGLGKIEFGWAMFISGAFVNAVPGIIVQIILIPILVIALKKYTANQE